MKFDTFGDGEDLLWVMGWGNRAESRHERWFLDRLVEAGYRVHTAELPTNVSDVQQAWVEPVADYRDDLDEHALLGHSAGGLVLAHLDADARRVYLSPWWGFPAGQPAVLHLLARVPTSVPILPAGIDPAALGELAEPADVTAPDRASPAFVRAAMAAQEALEPIDPDAVVFCSLRDEVVSVRAIGEHADAAQIELYDGGHELFASAGREAHVERVLDAIEGKG